MQRDGLTIFPQEYLKRKAKLNLQQKEKTIDKRATKKRRLNRDKVICQKI